MVATKPVRFAGQPLGPHRHICAFFHDDAEPLIEEAIQDGAELGYPLTRLVANVDILRTHPAAVIGGVIHEPPFFIPPDEFLQELRERRASASLA